MKQCKDCLAEGVLTDRPATYPGPRCASHHRVFKHARSARSHALSIKRKYGITAEEYAALYEFQGRRCALCRRATGASKRLAVDHNHQTSEVRGLLCGVCNEKVIGYSRDDPEFFYRGAHYLEDPPFRRLKRGDKL